jgi:hypothetical protein
MMRSVWARSLFFVLASASVVTCNLEEDETSSLSTSESTTESASVTIQSQIFSGKVVDGNGTAIVGARVTINGIVRVTSSTGQYTVSIADAPRGYQLDVRKDGYGPLTELRLVGATGLVHRMSAGATRTIDPTKPNTLVDPASGIQVVVPANALRSATGAPIGTVRFTIIPHSSQTMPGDFTAQTTTGARVALISVGAVTLQAVDSQNNTLGVATGATLNVNLPVPSSAGSSMPTCVLSGACRTAIWRFNPTTSLWVEQPAATPAFGTGATAFGIPGARQGGVIDPADGLGTWNADIEFSTPACTVIELSNIPLTCYNPPPGTTPEPGISVSFTQALAGGGTKSKTSDVRSSAAFIVLYNLRPNVDIDLSFTFPPGAPANCAANFSITSTPAPTAGFPFYSATGGVTRVSTGAPWGGTGYPTDPGGSPVDLLDIVLGTHPCNSRVTAATF